MMWTDTLTTLAIGAMGGVIAIIVEHTYLHLREKSKEKQQRLISFSQSERIIDNSIFSYLRHGASIELMKSGHRK